MKTIALTLQHENWEDDAGAHDVCIYQLTDEDYDDLLTTHILDRDSDLYKRLEAGRITPTFPITIDNAIDVWYSF